MSFLINPYFAGCMYGGVVGLELNNKKIVSEPITGTIDVIAKAAVYGITADITTKLFLERDNKKALSIILLGVSGYKLYKYFVNLLKNNY